MDRTEINRLWDAARNQSAPERFSRWLDWRVKKGIAKWSGNPRADETRLFWGQEMTIVYPEYVSGKIGRTGYFETDLTALFVDVLRPGMVVYDVGSHYGYFTLLASELVGDSGKVFAFEPTANTYRILCENASRRDNITCTNAAAFRESCELTFWDSGHDQSAVNFIVHDQNRVGHDHSNGGRAVSVEAVKLDEFAEQHLDPDFVKIDAEGAEAAILEGMSEIIERSHPAVSLEMSDDVCAKTGNKSCRENAEWLLDHGYTVYDYCTCEPNRHELANKYSYDNLLFRHDSWRFFQS